MNKTPADRLDLGSLRLAVRKTYIENPKDKQIAAHLDAMVKNKKDFERGAASPRRGLFVIGNPGSGKSTSIRCALAAHPDLQPRVNEWGETAPQYLSLKLPKKSATIDLVSNILKAMRLPHEGREKEMTDEMKNQFRQRGIWLLHLDELQHTVRSNTAKAFMAIRDLLKEMLDDEEWPLHMILSGVPRVDKIYREGQIRRRSERIIMHPLEAPANNGWFKELMTRVAVGGCGLELSEEVGTDEFYERLCRSTRGAWGTTIERIQEVSFSTLERGRKVLNVRDFGREYERISGCTLSENLFMAPNFRDIELDEEVED